LPSICGQRRRTNTFSAPRSDIRITLPGLSEWAAANKRKCCAISAASNNRTYEEHERDRIARQAWWRLLHDAGDSWLSQRTDHALAVEVLGCLVNGHIEAVDPDECLMSQVMRLEVVPDDLNVV
jgi:hypothetical protein